MNEIENESHLHFDYTTNKKEMSLIQHFFRLSSQKIYIANIPLFSIIPI